MQQCWLVPAGVLIVDLLRATEEDTQTLATFQEARGA